MSNSVLWNPCKKGKENLRNMTIPQNKWVFFNVFSLFTYYYPRWLWILFSPSHQQTYKLRKSQKWELKHEKLPNIELNLQHWCICSSSIAMAHHAKLHHYEITHYMGCILHEGLYHTAHKYFAPIYALFGQIYSIHRAYLIDCFLLWQGVLHTELDRF